MFNIDDRDRARNRLMKMATSDSRVVAGAILGSLADNTGDRWSDLDISFAVANEFPVTDVLEDWSLIIVLELGGVHLFDLPSGAMIYRVFLLPNCLELDLSIAPASEFGPAGPTFKVMFGEAVDRPDEPPTPPEKLFGYAVHHALHARMAIERGRYWQAEYWISAVRDHALVLACRRRGLDGWYGRDVDRLPADTLDPLRLALVRTLDREELDRALKWAVAGVLRESDGVGEIRSLTADHLRELVGDASSLRPKKRDDDVLGN